MLRQTRRKPWLLGLCLCHLRRAVYGMWASWISRIEKALLLAVRDFQRVKFVVHKRGVCGDRQSQVVVRIRQSRWLVGRNHHRTLLHPVFLAPIRADHRTTRSYPFNRMRIPICDHCAGMVSSGLSSASRIRHVPVPGQPDTNSLQVSWLLVCFICVPSTELAADAAIGLKRCWQTLGMFQTSFVEVS